MGRRPRGHKDTPMLSIISTLMLFAEPQLPLPNDPAAQVGNRRSGADQLLPGTKRCPDGSIMRTADRCVEWPDHRFAYTHEPLRQVWTRGWWCTGSAQPSQFDITVRWIQPERPNGTPTQAKRLDRLVINGQAAPPAVKKSIQQHLDSFYRFDDAGGRCLAIRSGGTIPVLTLHGVAMVDGKLKSKHEEIPLR